MNAEVKAAKANFDCRCMVAAELFGTNTADYTNEVIEADKAFTAAIKGQPMIDFPLILEFGQARSLERRKLALLDDALEHLVDYQVLRAGDGTSDPITDGEAGLWRRIIQQVPVSIIVEVLGDSW